VKEFKTVKRNTNVVELYCGFLEVFWICYASCC